MPVFLLLSILQPVLWMLLFGQLFGVVTTLEGFEAESYVQYITPGISIMTALFSAAYNGIGLLRDIESGVFDRLLATPVSRGAVVASRVLLAASQVMLQAGVILILGLVLGARAYGGVIGLLCVLLAASLLAAAFAATSCGMALITRRQEMVIAAMNFIVLPTTFLSSMIMTRQSDAALDSHRGALQSSRLGGGRGASRLRRPGLEPRVGRPASALLAAFTLALRGLCQSMRFRPLPAGHVTQSPDGDGRDQAARSSIPMQPPLRLAKCRHPMTIHSA